MRQRALVLLLLVAAVLGAGCLDGLLQPSVVAPAIVPVEGAALDRTPVHAFPFEDGSGTIRIDPDPAVYAGAKGADRQLYLRKDLGREEWIPIYYLAFVNDSYQEPFYADLLAALREIRDREGLDDDRYLELIAAFVQAVPYRTDASIIEPKFPIETYVDVEGDCDDKSLLLAGLLAREGYGVALFYFEDEAHMAVGVRSSGCSYRDTAYAYIEATNASYVGIAPETLSNGAALATDPLVIPVGDGPLLYAACGEVRTIEHALSASRERVGELEPELAVHARDLESRKEAIEAFGARLAALSRSGEIREYNRLVPEHNGMVREYNDAAASYNVLLEESRAAVEIHNYLVTHAHDRPGSYLRARAYLTA
ncbi:hypothetical protein F8E02_01970 [Methanoculleus sp. Wushi-C6]|uniref:Transglutaminase-like domain-containing protein n=2 Tax=Methanoculleus caldifontis TaxID=2651577 RepID=A0ABU3WYB6_9EURY|nr:hypothetical protein [Methanoculleus sp. Wushi-C6]